MERASAARSRISISHMLFRQVKVGAILNQSPCANNQSRAVNSSKKNSPKAKAIAENRRARRDYAIEETLEAGLELQGWEVKSLRAGRGSLNEAYAHIRSGEAWLVGAHISPLPSTSTHAPADPVRTRRLLLHRHEIDRLVGMIERKGYTLVPLDLHWTRGRAKLRLGLARGKKKHDKRAADRDRDWQRQKQRMLKSRRGS